MIDLKSMKVPSGDSMCAGLLGAYLFDEAPFHKHL